MWRKNYTCSVCKMFSFDKPAHVPGCRLDKGNKAQAEVKPEVKVDKVVDKPVEKVNEVPEVKELWKSFYAGGGKNAVYDVRLGDKSGKLAEGGDNISKDDALALVEKLNA